MTSEPVTNAERLTQLTESLTKINDWTGIVGQRRLKQMLCLVWQDLSVDNRSHFIWGISGDDDWHFVPPAHDVEFDQALAVANEANLSKKEREFIDSLAQRRWMTKKDYRPTKKQRDWVYQIAERQHQIRLRQLKDQK